MPPTYDVITFDCYGTLIDWDRGISEALVAAASRAGVALDTAEALEAYHAVEPAVQARPTGPIARCWPTSRARWRRGLAGRSTRMRPGASRPACPTGRRFPIPMPRSFASRGQATGLGFSRMWTTTF